MKIISPSLLNSDTYQIKEQFEALEKCGINYIHIDITDGHFVPMISFGANTVKDLRKHTDFVLDCHLMVENPENLIPVIVGAGACCYNDRGSRSGESFCILQHDRDGNCSGFDRLQFNECEGEIRGRGGSRYL